MKPMDPIKVLFVCLGNICRSPAAEASFKKLVNERGLISRFEIDSCGTSGYHDGEEADPRTRSVAKSRGTLITHISRKIRNSDFDHFDYILVMDKNNLNTMRMLAKTEAQRKKIFLFGSFSDDPAQEVPDPYYGEISEFEFVQTRVENFSKEFLIYLEKNYEINS